MAFIILHNSFGDKRIVNTNNIIFIKHSNSCSNVYFNDGETNYIEVKETLDEIMEIIKKAESGK